jgi:hypothetical protein
MCAFGPLRADVATAAFLSALFPGLGQFYNGRWVKGACFLFAALLDGGALLVVANPVQLEQWARATRFPADIGFALSLMLTLLGLALWSVLDATRDARAIR